MKAAHQYRIRIDHISPDGSDTAGQAFEFTFASHDELLTIIDTLQHRSDISPQQAAPLGLGIKLFGSVMMKHRSEPLFADLWPHFSGFMKNLKKQPR
ncbi:MULTISPECIES: DUF3861 domain-containing protein [unclassified Oceanobacter]|uniref:DUF3861 domain-containing protein n=2 Tax=unclassified Oceanobacter TaxID=2620260 RepID=UPI0026E335B9|nr:MULTISPECIES: DUF3861 domain-containing protein [unclassified Oceanobacter]MDO6682468.1 DUF3861 domain-containing protein [Oceanobacter sp. 5_MG-2023]MDP2506414.1 DUF3861 domain-containing protein [Oceanobacter sp. 3_MG-2023]MDP2548779.1 DUF3861 domain-containing protein [Oceanobacter sp. 4_MG-2023]